MWPIEPGFVSRPGGPEDWIRGADSLRCLSKGHILVHRGDRAHEWIVVELLLHLDEGGMADEEF